MPTLHLYYRAGVPLNNEVSNFIEQHGGNTISVHHRRYIEVVDAGGSGKVAAQSSFILDAGRVMTEAIVVDPAYAGANIGPYMQGLAGRLFGSGD